MLHNCIKLYARVDKSKAHDEPCDCDCKNCLEFKRCRSLPLVSNVERQALWSGFIEEMTAGPWTTGQLHGFGARRFLISENVSAKWHAVIADLENVGSFDSDKWLAWCHDGVPRLLLTIEQLEKEIVELKEQLKK